MKKIWITYSLSILVFVVFAAFVLGCASTNESIATRSGAQLWGENCMRCHNAPSPDAFNDDQWETIVLHMRIRANLTEKETEKIVAFLQSAN